jgi:ubiquinone/menaquinone biosynthesis C-methylase UbiE
VTGLEALKRRVLASRIWGAFDNPAVFHLARYALVGGQRTTRRLLAEHLATAPEETVLDVCCGVGEFADVVDCGYVGIDLNERFIGRAQRRHAGDRRKRFEVADVMRLEYAAGHFDKAMIVNSLHHFSDEETLRLLTEVRRITRKAVVVVDADGTPRGPIRRALIALDRGRFMRSPEALAVLVRRVLPVERTVRFDVGLYTEVLFRCSTGPAAAARTP